jgi:hypothetical protein
MVIWYSGRQSTLWLQVVPILPVDGSTNIILFVVRCNFHEKVHLEIIFEIFFCIFTMLYVKIEYWMREILTPVLKWGLYQSWSPL